MSGVPLLFLIALCGPLHSAQYPERPVSIIVSVGPGAGPDVIARILADRLTHL
jgi:tripartite-type tricarboxylate transporter receptor subunit TctC